jgi:hypothetical protein
MLTRIWIPARAPDKDLLLLLCRANQKHSCHLRLCTGKVLGWNFSPNQQAFVRHQTPNSNLVRMQNLRTSNLMASIFTVSPSSAATASKVHFVLTRSPSKTTISVGTDSLRGLVSPRFGRLFEGCRFPQGWVVFSPGEKKAAMGETHMTLELYSWETKSNFSSSSSSVPGSSPGFIRLRLRMGMSFVLRAALS